GAAREDLAAGLDEIVREGARRMLAAALEEEVAAYYAAYAGERDEDGRRLVVRNGHARPRQVTTAAGAVEVTAPRSTAGSLSGICPARITCMCGLMASLRGAPRP